MYDHEIDTFIVVAKLGSFSAAARAMYISKPAVTQQINLLETKLSCKLFVRDSHGVTLTEAGKLFLVQAHKIKQLCLATKQILQNYQNTLTVGTGYLSTTNLFDHYWTKFAQNKQVKLKFQEIKDYEQIPPNIDLVEGIYSEEPLPKQGFLFKKITTTPLMVVVPPTNVLAQKKQLKITDLNNQRIWLVKNNVLSQSAQIQQFIQQNCHHVNISNYSVYNKAQVNAALLNNSLILVHQALASSCAPFLVKKVAWNFDAAVGFFYRNHPNNVTHNFIASLVTSKSKSANG